MSDGHKNGFVEEAGIYFKPEEKERLIMLSFPLSKEGNMLVDGSSCPTKRIFQWLYFKRGKEEDITKVSLYQPIQTEILHKEVVGVNL